MECGTAPVNRPQIHHGVPCLYEKPIKCIIIINEYEAANQSPLSSHSQCWYPRASHWLGIVRAWPHLCTCSSVIDVMVDPDGTLDALTSPALPKHKPSTGPQGPLPGISAGHGALTSTPAGVTEPGPGLRPGRLLPSGEESSVGRKWESIHLLLHPENQYIWQP